MDLIPHRICDDLARALDFSGDKPPKIIVCDLPPKLVTPNLLQVIAKRPEHCVLAGIDHTLPPESGAQLNWVPSFFGRASPKTRFGWDCYLLEKPIHTKSWSPRPEVVILTGGSDTYRLGRTLPALLHTALPPELTITWIQGPFAPPPDRPAERFQVHHNPPDISALLARAGYALAVYGVSFFECLAHGLPTVVLTPDRPEDDLELTALDDTETALRATTTEQAVTMLAELCRDETAAELLAKTANKLIDGKGPQRLAEALMDLVQEATSRR
ncbi:MAG: hypothetical protein QNK37_12035 [Acidobacteriota bacterium]|nr:hypothetical protein [Acidobacteriota bacterium]